MAGVAKPNPKMGKITLKNKIIILIKINRSIIRSFRYKYDAFLQSKIQSNYIKNLSFKIGF